MIIYEWIANLFIFAASLLMVGGALFILPAGIARFTSSMAASIHLLREVFSKNGS